MYEFATPDFPDYLMLAHRDEPSSPDEAEVIYADLDSGTGYGGVCIIS
ncbi:B mating type pheromone-like protein [Gelatoporia subvermispora B]|uniref:B mating type pheromone-like protein n=1 Tax=Ceriporiopsis subvermispora (strain B) TaxID=914234 RepID=M2QDV3_CERS8|nr:B mating type pheromone-like protein [Gelatoporia subvermispora B]